MEGGEGARGFCAGGWSSRAAGGESSTARWSGRVWPWRRSVSLTAAPPTPLLPPPPTPPRFEGTKINVIDTPGHADFGGEVERVLNMCDGVVLLVDSVEGPMPQTRFVTKKALQLNKKVVVVVNKVDRPAARPDWVVDATYELFMDLGANDDQCEFPIVFASGVKGIAGVTVDTMAEDLQPLFEMIVKSVRGGDCLVMAPLAAAGLAMYPQQPPNLSPHLPHPLLIHPLPTPP
jgi:small GTP-binding protein